MQTEALPPSPSTHSTATAQAFSHPQRNGSVAESDSPIEIGHVLFIEIVNPEKESAESQSTLLQQLNELIHATPQFQIAESTKQLLHLQSNSGAVLIYRVSPETALHSAIEITKALGKRNEIQTRMGIHSGPVSELPDENSQRARIAGAGISVARRVMECGDAGHILLSKSTAEKLALLPRWQSHLHPLGARETKQGAVISLVNFVGEEAGNPAIPETMLLHSQLLLHRRRDIRATRSPASAMPFLLIAGSLLAFAWFFANPPARNPDRWRETSTTSRASVAGNRVAILPFTPVGNDRETRSLAGEIRAEIFGRLVTMSDWEVIDGENNRAENSQPLSSVAYVLQGNVERQGQHLHIHVRLIKPRTGASAWSQEYRCELAKLPLTEKEIAQAVAAKLPTKRNR